MAPRQRKHNPSIPSHIDQNAIPKGVYWDATGKGRWYRFVQSEGKPARETLAGPAAKLSDLHAMIEPQELAGTVEWLSKQYHASAKFAKLAKSTQDDYEYSRDVALGIKTTSGTTFGKLEAKRLAAAHIQRIVDRLDNEGTPTKANKVLRYLRLLFRWGVNRGLCPHNPAQGVEAAQERKKRRLPPTDVYTALLRFAQERGALKAHTEGSVAPYLWLVMELGYMCRLRGIETVTLTLAAETPEGIQTNRRKRSRDSLVQWNPRLRAAWDAAVALRQATLTRLKRPEMLRLEDRALFLSQGGEPLSKSGLDTAWQRLIKLAIEKDVIAPEQRFGLHDLKRKGGTEAAGSKGERQDALGVSDAMMKVYDHSVPRVKPSGFTE
ncbi:site-specific integrase [Lysobacter sp. HA35]